MSALHVLRDAARLVYCLRLLILLHFVPCLTVCEAHFGITIAAF